jgi:sporulation protein YlmC with PRC-barrel domain
MKPGDAIRLLSMVYDLPLIDKDGNYCGIVDDIRFAGGPGKTLAIEALLVGPGAYAGRLPRWAHWLVTRLAGDRVTVVPWHQVAEISSALHLKCTANELGLHVAENKARRLIPRAGAL